MSEHLGPNVKRLIARKVAADAIPANGGFVDGLKFLLSKEKFAAGILAAAEWATSALAAVRLAAEPNPWKTADDESIAGELLRRIDAAIEARHRSTKP